MSTEQATQGQVSVGLFRATKDSHRFTKNQKVFVYCDCGNYLLIYHRWRGKGRFVYGKIDVTSPLIGEIRKIEVDAAFAKRVQGSH